MKTLCKYKGSEIKKEFKAIKKIVEKPKFICMKCLRSANEKKALCGPKKL